MLPVRLAARAVVVALVVALAAALFAVVSATEQPTPATVRHSASVSARSVVVRVAWRKPFMTRRCASDAGFNCYWLDPNPAAPNWSFYSIPIGLNRKCIQFRKPKVNKKYGFCTKKSARAATGPGR